MPTELSKTKTVADVKSKLLKQAAVSVKRTGELMRAFPQQPADQPASKTSEIVVNAVDGERPGLTVAKELLKNRVQSALVMQELVYGNASVMDVKDHCEVLRTQGELAASGDISDLKSMLAVQAIVLDGIFTQFARRAAMAKGNDDLERMMRLALKAQSQCRTTVESLAVIQQGPTIFAKQANIANGGPQQVNNGSQPAQAAQGSATEPAHLLEPATRARGGKSSLAKQTIPKVAG